MIELRALSLADINLLDGLSYGEMPKAKRTDMLFASEKGVYDGKYFKLFTVVVDGNVVGVMNVCKKSESVVSVSPEIKEKYRRKGYAFEGEKVVLELFKKEGCKIALATIRDDNFESLAFHEKLGFEYVKEYTNLQGKRLKLYLKSL